MQNRLYDVYVNYESTRPLLQNPQTKRGARSVLRIFNIKESTFTSYINYKQELFNVHL